MFEGLTKHLPAIEKAERFRKQLGQTERARALWMTQFRCLLRDYETTVTNVEQAILRLLRGRAS